jgi:L-fuconolactonase
MKFIDAHQHFWQLSRSDCEWPQADLAAIYRDFLPDDYLSVLPSSFEKSVLVQTQPCDSDSDFLLELARAHPFVGAVIAWLDFDSACYSERIDTLVKHPLFRGVRPMLQAIDETEWILQSQFDQVFAALCERSLRFDALVQPRHIGAIESLAERWPELALIVNHAAKPDIAQQKFEDWARDIEKLAQHAQVHCKLSGLVTEALPEQCLNTDAIQPYVRHLLDCFGPRRVIWGSDWPVVNLRVSFERWLELSREMLNSLGLSEQDQEHVFYANARRFYDIER